MKKQYQKSLTAWTFYWQAMLLSAWHNMMDESSPLQERLIQAQQAGKAEFVRVLRLASYNLVVKGITYLTKVFVNIDKRAS